MHEVVNVHPRRRMSRCGAFASRPASEALKARQSLLPRKRGSQTKAFAPGASPGGIARRPPRRIAHEPDQWAPLIGVDLQRFLAG